MSSEASSRRLEWAAIGFGMWAVWWFGSWWNQWGVRNHVPQYGALSSALQTMAGILVTIAIHETGHIVAGLAMDMKLVQVTVGPLAWRLRGGRFQFQFEAKGLVGGGSAAMVPRSLHRILRRQTIMVLGGPVASIATCIAATVLTLASPGTFLAPFWFVLSNIAVFSVIGGPWNLIPMRPGSQYSDGAQLYQLLTRGPWANVHLARAMVATSVATPLRPRDWDGDLLERSMRAVSHGTQGLLNRMYACVHHLDAGRMLEAGENFVGAARLCNEAPGEVTADMAAEMLFLSAVVFRDPEAARAWWNRVELKGDSSRRLGYWRALAALRWLENDPERAAVSLAKAEEFARQLPQAGAYEYDRDSLHRLRAAIEQSSMEPASMV